MSLSDFTESLDRIVWSVEIKYWIVGIGLIILILLIIFRKKIWFNLKEAYLNITTVKIFVGGMVPNETALALIDDDNNKEVIFKSLCNEFGEFEYRLSRKYVGKKLRFPIRQSPFKFNHEEQIVIQPWGHFEAIRMEKDYADVNREKMSDEARKFDNKNYADTKYYDALYKSQYLARNQINITSWFILVSTLTVVAALIGTGVDYRVSIIISLLAWSIRAWLKRRTLGLSKKPIKHNRKK